MQVLASSDLTTTQTKSNRNNVLSAFINYISLQLNYNTNLYDMLVGYYLICLYRFVFQFG